jgi:hypothetical protein
MKHWKSRLRNRLRRFMGWNLPRRRMDLKFGLVPPNRRGRKPRIRHILLTRLRKKSAYSRADFLEKVHTEMKALNRYAISPGRRLLLSALVLKQFYPVALECHTQYSKEAGIPDDDARQESLDLAAAITRALATSYKIVFQHYYDSSRFWYARNRKRAYLCAFRVLELVKLEQRLLGLRYRQLPPRAWQDINTLFVILASYESVDFPMQRLDSLVHGNTKNLFAKPHDIYVAIQAYALLDHTIWPVEQHGFIDTYRNSLDAAVSANLDVTGGGGRDMLYASIYHAAPPAPQAPPGNSTPRVFINCSVLANSIRRDFQDLLKSKAEDNDFKVPRLLSGLQDIYQIAIASLMYRSIKHGIRQPDAERIGEPAKGLHMYVGFEDVTNHLQAVFDPDPMNREKPRLADVLADRSALLGEDHTATEESLWHVLYSDAQLFELQTQETRFTTPMGIGSLLAYGVGAKDRGRPRLGFVSRIYRPQPRTVRLEIRRMARFAEPVRVRKEVQVDRQEKRRSENANPEMSGFMVHDRHFGWGLLLPNQSQIWQNSPITLYRHGQGIRLKLGKVLFLTHYFILLGLPEELRGMDRPEYPGTKATDGAFGTEPATGAEAPMTF